MQMQRVRTVRAECVAKPSVKPVRVPAAAHTRSARLAGLVGGAAALLAQRPASAAEGDAIDATVSAAVDAVKATGAAVKTGLDILGAGAKALKSGYDVASPYIKQGVDAVTPAVQSAYKATSEVAGPAISKAVPIVQETLTGAIKSSGVDIDTVAKSTATAAKAATEGATAAKPLLQQALTFLSSSDPATLAQYGLGGIAVYLLSPMLLGGVAGGLRGYAGDIGAVSALEAVGRGDAVIVDIRTEREKEAAGIPDVPGGASKLVELELYSVADRKLRGGLRDPTYIEAQVTALQVAALKRVSKGMRVILLDRNGSSSKAVARELAKRGFGRVFVVDGGFDGWVRSKLLVKPVAGAGLAPLPAIARTVSSRGLSRTVSSTTRKQLPAPRG
ncbi:MAG: hypothetical protein J3K34DRAFT_454792 [Monoraphidium minutum]|nr:MAG: hypothetical protein J3K34DRAFT_454792 [Monoraphidium minutum]